MSELPLEVVNVGDRMELDFGDVDDPYEGDDLGILCECGRWVAPDGVDCE